MSEKTEEITEENTEEKTEENDVELNNAVEEVLETAERCIRCGLCKELCPVFKILREEACSPRGHIALFSEKIFEKIAYECSLCKACEEKCPLDLKICDSMRKARKILSLKGKENEACRKMLEKIQKKENPYS